MGSLNCLSHSPFFFFFFTYKNASFCSGSSTRSLFWDTRNPFIYAKFWMCLYHLKRLLYWVFCSSVISTMFSYNWLNMNKSANVRWFPTKNVRHFRYFWRYWDIKLAYFSKLFSFLQMNFYVCDLFFLLFGWSKEKISPHWLERKQLSSYLESFC